MILESDADYIRRGFLSLPFEMVKIRVSEWAEQKRFIPSEFSPKPGYWSNDWNPHFVEIMDALSDDSPIQQVTLMKSAQIGATTAAENWIGYTIDESPAPFFYLTADKDLAESAMEQKISALILHCGLSEKIKASDPTSRRTGSTKSLKEFAGGFIRAVGANNPGKLRSISVKRFYGDELDGMPDTVGEEGDPIRLALKRTNAYGRRRKIFFTSTPAIMQTSKINRLYKLGDQRQRFVPCPHCGHMQVLTMKGTKEDGTRFGLNIEIDEDGYLIPESVFYICADCGTAIFEHHKPEMFKKGEWRPTARARDNVTRSYHINALYSPLGMYSWEDIAREFVEVFDIAKDRIKDLEGYKSFVNTILGLPWEERGEAPTYERVITHRRAIYSRNKIPNESALRETGSQIAMLTAAADVHKTRIDIEIVGWCVDGRSYSIDWRHLEPEEGKTVEDLDSDMWKKLADILENERWTAEDGRSYGIMLTLIDAGYATDSVRRFCSNYSAGVLPIFGRDSMRKTSAMKNFYFHEKTNAADINVTLYKDRLASWLRSDWRDGELQPVGYPNYPSDYGDDFFREYEAEHKLAEKSRKTGQIIGYTWQKVPNKPNHAWDCRVYNMAALDMYALEITRELSGDAKALTINYADFWRWAIENGDGILWENC